MSIVLSERNVSKIYCVALLILPVLFEYTTGIATITVGDAFLMLCFFLMLLVTKNRNNRIKVHLSLLILYVFIQAVCILAIQGMSRTIMTAMRYLFYLACIYKLTDVCLEREWIFKRYEMICIIGTVLEYIQTFMIRAFGVAVPGVIRAFPLTDPSMYNYSALLYGSGNRCFSFFGEPSHYAIYMLPCVLIYLLDGNLNKKKAIKLLFVILGILMSSAFTGMLGLVASFGLWIIKLFKKRVISARTLGFVLGLGIVGLIVVSTTGIGSYLRRSDMLSSASSGRFSGYNFIFTKYNPTTTQILFGNGMHDLVELDVYLPGWPRMYFYYGLIGSIIYVKAFSKCRNRNSLSSALLLLLCVMAVGTEVNFNPFILVYMALICSYENNELLGQFLCDRK